MYESSVYRCSPVCEKSIDFEFFLPAPDLLTATRVVFSLGIQVDQQSKQVICELFCKR